MISEIRDLYAKTFNVSPLEVKKISADGSNRKYFRCFSNQGTCIGVYNEDKKENIAFLDYARQLKKKGISVPEVLGEDIENNVYLLQDLGDTTLYQYLQNNNRDNVIKVYKEVIEELPKIQILAGKDFNYENAYPRSAFDEQSIQWDLNYFKYYFLKLAGIAFDEEELEKDFSSLTSYLLNENTSYFLFRDFQSRNIMLVGKELKPYFIDFQGGRKGALQYDIASLLYDAKADIIPTTRRELLDIYISEVEKYIKIDKEDFCQHYFAYVYVRIMQAMGSYGYRGYFEQKREFLKSIPYALNNLAYLEKTVHLPIELNTLHLVFKRIIASEKLQSLNNSNKKLTVTIKSFSYKKGFPQDVSGNGGGFIFDCRALPNPARIDKFKHMTGLDSEVIEYLASKEEVNYFLENAVNLVNQSCKNYLERHFTNLSVYFGCTGGQHRSVYCAEKLSKILSQNTDLNIIVNHIEQNI
jgi:aminoglycoside/choline kinase family phosphotransferase